MAATMTDTVESRPQIARAAVADVAGGQRVADEFDALPSKISVKDLDFFYGKQQALFDNSIEIKENRVTADHRPVGLRQVDAHPHLQPHLRALPRAARHRRDLVRRPEHPRAGRPTCSTCAGASA